MKLIEVRAGAAVRGPIAATTPGRGTGEGRGRLLACEESARQSRAGAPEAAAPNELIGICQIAREWHLDTRTVHSYVACGLIREAPRPARGYGSKRQRFFRKDVERVLGDASGE